MPPHEIEAHFIRRSRLDVPVFGIQLENAFFALFGLLQSLPVLLVLGHVL